jgi:glycosyltransferase involved in cell wall biosynthesis
MSPKVIITITNDITHDQRMIKTAHTLISLGYEVEIIGRIRPNSKELVDTKYNTTRLKCVFDSGKLFYIEYNIRLYLYLRKQQFGNIIAVDLDTIIPSYYAGKKAKATLYYDAHEYFTEVPEVTDRPMVKRIWKWIEKTYLPKYDYIYTVCESIADLFYSEYKKPCAVIRNVPFRNTKNNESSKSEKYILYQGALNVGRGLEAMIAAMKSIEGVVLKIAGDGDICEELKSLVTENNLSNKVFFLGNLSPTDLREVTAGAYIGVNLLENKGLNYYYSLANKFFDYIQLGIPSVNMNFPEYIIVVDQYQCAVLIDDLEPTTIIHSVNHLLNDQIKYDRIKSQCLIASADLCWEVDCLVFKEKLGF